MLVGEAVSMDGKTLFARLTQAREASGLQRSRAKYRGEDVQNRDRND